MRWLVVACLLVVAPASAPASAQDLGAEDRAMIESVIRAQLAAFLRDDEAAAFGYAAPGIQASFQSPANFMEMVRRGYQPVYRPRTFEFREVRKGPAGPEQRVFVIGPDGKAYVAIYPMERQPDGTWRVNGCFLVRDPSV